uniref:Ig-like domain-containing protein n=1 Tax=Sus scrofa TaxID=9823 RepID=A0A8D0Q4L1_PIG
QPEENISLLELLGQVLLCVRGVDVGQRPPVLSLTEGISDTIWCNSSASVLNVLWYRQNPGGRLIELFYIPTGTKQNGRLNATTVTTERRSSLYISSAQITDSATYFCAVQHSAPQAPTACTGTLRGAQPLLQPQSQPGLHQRAFALLPSQSRSPSPLAPLLARRVADKRTKINKYVTTVC